MRDRLVQFLIEERANDLNGHRARIAALAQPRPFATQMMSKLVMSEFRRRLYAFAVSLQGANATLYVGDPDAYSDGDFQRGYMNAFSATIGGGTSQIQMNISGRARARPEQGVSAMQATHMPTRAGDRIQRRRSVARAERY